MVLGMASHIGTLPDEPRRESARSSRNDIRRPKAFSLKFVVELLFAGDGVVEELEVDIERFDKWTISYSGTVTKK